MNFTLDEAFVAVDENDAKKLALILKECPKFLNQYGEKGPWTGFTLLIYSILKYHYECSKTLIEHGANVNKKAKVGGKQACLILQIGYWVDLEIFEMTLKAGAKVNSPNRFSKFPLGQAVEFASVDKSEANQDKASKMVKLLLKFGADPDYSPGRERSARKYLEDISNFDPGCVPNWLLKLIPVGKM